jgi:hypothetical protein
MSLLPRRRAPGSVLWVALATLFVPFPSLAAYAPDDPCRLQYKAPSYDRRAFAELASGFLVPENRPFPYVITPRLILLRPLDAAYRWSLSGSIAGRFGDGASQGTIGVRLHRSIASSASQILPGLTIGLGPELVLAHEGGFDAVAEVTVDLTPLMIGARGSWGPIRFSDDAFNRPARLETFIGWRITGWRRQSTPLEDLLHQPPPPRRRFHPRADAAWADDFEKAVTQLSDPGSYLSLVQQLTIRFGAQFEHGSQDCGRQRTRLQDARAALAKALRDSVSATDVRQRSRLESLLREQSEAFASSLTESVEYASAAEYYNPNPLVLAPAVMHAMNCVLEGPLSSSCIRVQP